MKKVFAFVVLVSFGLGLISCSSDDDSVDGPNYTVVGKWSITSYTINGVSQEDCTTNGVRQFKTDGTYLQDEYLIDPETEECTETIESPLIGTYTKTSTELKTVLGGLTKTYELEFVSENKFILTETYNNVDFVLTYTRI